MKQEEKIKKHKHVTFANTPQIFKYKTIASRKMPYGLDSDKPDILTQIARVEDKVPVKTQIEVIEAQVETHSSKPN